MWALRRRTKCMVGMLTYFNRAWSAGMPEMQKACFTYFVTDSVPCKERMCILEKWSNWAEFLVGAAGYRDFLGQMLHCYHTASFTTWNVSQAASLLNVRMS